MNNVKETIPKQKETVKEDEELTILTHPLFPRILREINDITIIEKDIKDTFKASSHGSIISPYIPPILTSPFHQYFQHDQAIVIPTRCSKSSITYFLLNYLQFLQIKKKKLNEFIHVITNYILLINRSLA